MREFLKGNDILKNAFVMLCFLAIALVMYFPIIHSDPLWDDWIFIFKSLTLRNVAAWDFWLWGEHRRSWPMFYSFLSLMYKSFGDKTTYYHLASIIIHSLNSYLIFKVIEKTKGSFAFLLALIYLVHPLNFFTVSWIIQVKTLLCIFFFLIALIFFLNYLKSDSKSSYWLSFVSFSFSLLSKVSFAPVVLIMLFYSRKTKVLPFILICLYSVTLTLWSTHIKRYLTDVKIPTYFISNVYAGERPMRKLGPKAIPPKEPLSKIVLTLNNFNRYAGYVFFPSRPLLVEKNTDVSYSYKEMLLSIVVIMGLVVLVYRMLVTQSYYALSGISFFAITLLPLCGLFFVPIFHYSNFVEYWLSVPVLGILFAFSRIKEKKIEVSCALVVGALFFSFFTASTSHKTPNPVDMITEASNQSPDNNLIKLILAKHYYFTREYIKANTILLNVRKKNVMDKEALDKDIELNLKLMNGEEHEAYTL